MPKLGENDDTRAIIGARGGPARVYNLTQSKKEFELSNYGGLSDIWFTPLEKHCVFSTN